MTYSEHASLVQEPFLKQFLAAYQVLQIFNMTHQNQTVRRATDEN